MQTGVGTCIGVPDNCTIQILQHLLYHFLMTNASCELGHVIIKKIFEYQFYYPSAKIINEYSSVSAVFV